MLAKRIIPCLDIKDGQTVKGTNFVNLRHAGDPVELARAYSEQGADELVFLDITASFEERKTFAELVKRIAANISIPFTVGGGIHELSDVDRLLNAGADKISVNSSAIRRPGLIDEIAKHFGSQVCVLAVDAKQTEKGWWCYLNGGRVETDKELFAWTKEAQERGAGEVLFTSMNHDGVKTGYANGALAALARFRQVKGDVGRGLRHRGRVVGAVDGDGSPELQLAVRSIGIIHHNAELYRPGLAVFQRLHRLGVIVQLKRVLAVIGVEVERAVLGIYGRPARVRAISRNFIGSFYPRVCDKVMGVADGEGHGLAFGVGHSELPGNGGSGAFRDSVHAQGFRV